MKRPIHIITPESGALGQKYVIAHLAQHWHAWGYSVTSGPRTALGDSMGLMHVDQTLVSPALLPASSENSILLNGKVMDISKSNFSSLRVLPGDDWSAPVIVKSNLNCFGNPERRMRKAGLLEKAHRALARKNWKLARRLPYNDYPVLNTIAEVPDWVWRCEDLIVERFLPERVGDTFSIRGWLFFGERGYAYRLYSHSPVVKAGNISHFDILDAVPQELQDLRCQYGFDFGKFDYVEVEGRAVLIDINKTPTTVARQDSPRLRELAEGIRDFPGMGN